VIMGNELCMVNEIAIMRSVKQVAKTSAKKVKKISQHKVLKLNSTHDL